MPLRIRFQTKSKDAQLRTLAHLPIGCVTTFSMAFTNPSRSSLYTLYTYGGSRNFNIPCCTDHFFLSSGLLRSHCRKTLYSQCASNKDTHIQYWVDERDT